MGWYPPTAVPLEARVLVPADGYDVAATFIDEGAVYGTHLYGVANSDRRDALMKVGRAARRVMKSMHSADDAYMWAAWFGFDCTGYTTYADLTAAWTQEIANRIEGIDE